MKAEEDSDREVGEEPLAKSPGINAENMVSSMPVVHCWAVFTNIQNWLLCFLLPSFYLYVQPHEINPFL
jgi:hypothetical protein